MTEAGRREHLTDAGAKPDLGWLPVSRLRVDPSYQRTLEGRRSQRLIERIVAKFNWSAFQAVVVTSAEDGWVVIDGQHRVEAARRRGEPHVPAVIIKALSVAQQASIFVSANQDRVAINPVTLYQARLTAGEPDALAIQRVCEKAGLRIVQSKAGPSQPGQTSAVTALRDIIASHDESIAEAAISAVADACREKPQYLRANLMKAAASVVGAASESTACAAALREGLKRTDLGALFSSVTDEKQELGISELMAFERALKRLTQPQRPAVMKAAARPMPEENRINIGTLTKQAASERFAKLVRGGAPIEKIALAFGITEEECRRRARELEASR